jgi:hypothetical protein
MHERPKSRGRPRVIVVTQPMWRLKMTRAAPRRVLQALAIVGLLVGVHLARTLPWHSHSRALPPTAEESKR